MMRGSRKNQTRMSRLNIIITDLSRNEIGPRFLYFRLIISWTAPSPSVSSLNLFVNHRNNNNNNGDYNKHSDNNNLSRKKVSPYFFGMSMKQR